MAKKSTTAPTTPRAASAPRPRRAPARKPAAAPVDIATIAGTESLESAVDRAAGNGGPDGPSPDEIAEAAYHRYLSRGGQHGADFDDWVEAERALRESRERRSR
jgi:hypothetical protein